MRLTGIIAAMLAVICFTAAPASAASPYIGVFTDRNTAVNVGTTNTIDQFELGTACGDFDFFIRNGFHVNPRSGKFYNHGKRHQHSVHAVVGYTIGGTVRTSKQMVGSVKVKLGSCTDTEQFNVHWHPGPPA